MTTNVAPASVLSMRERQVLDLISQGLSNRAIATDLHLVEATVKNHVMSVMTKLGASNRAHAVRLGFESGLLHMEVPR